MHVRKIGQKPGKVLSFVKFVHHFSKKGGAHISKSLLLNNLKVVRDYNPWFSEEGTLGKELWNRAQRNIEKTYEETWRKMGGT